MTAPEPREGQAQQPKDSSDNLPAVAPGGWALDTYVPRPLSRRSERLAEQRRRRRTLVVAAVAAGVMVLVVGVVAGVSTLLGRGRQVTGAPEAAVPAVAVADAGPSVEPDVLLLVTHDEQEDARAHSIMLLASSPTGGAVVFVPTGLLLNVPGIGWDRVGAAQRYEDVTLVQESLAEALQMDIGAAAALDMRAMRRLFDAAEPMDVDREQELSGEEVARYWMLTLDEEAPLSELGRQQQIFTSLLERVAEDPAMLDVPLAEGALADGGLDQSSSADTEQLRTTLTRLAAALEADRLRFQVLPVQQFGGSGDSGQTVFRLAEEARSTVASLMSLASADTGALRVEVRGSSPDFGERMADTRLVEDALGDGFEVSLSTAIPEGETAETQILLHHSTFETREQAETVQQRLGLGTIAVDEQPQSVADITVVLGEDFPPE